VHPLSRRRLLQLGLAAAVGLGRPRAACAAPALARSLIVVWLKGSRRTPIGKREG